jgi:DNA-binding response OmpR family regulator
MKVIVIDDQQVATLQISAALRSLGHEPVCFASAISALEEIARNRVRVVVSDWRMPGLNGMALCEALRRRGGEYVYFILVTTAEMSRATRDAALAAGVDDFLAKPVDPDELKMRLHVAARILTFTAQVKQLESILPICGYCKKVRDDENYWAKIEEYLSKHEGLKLSHGVCPDCYEGQVVPQLKALGIG